MRSSPGPSRCRARDNRSCCSPIIRRQADNPKIATVVSADLPAVGRRGPGDALCFAAVTVEAAEELCRAAEHRLAELVASLEPITQRHEIDLRSLYAGNLISGVVSGLH
jgi:hypothetical protein